MLLGQLLLSQDISILVLVEALSLLLGSLNADIEKALMLKPGCVIQRFLLSIFLSLGGELSVVVRLPTVFFRWFDAIQIIFHLLPDERLREGVAIFLVTESK